MLKQFTKNYYKAFSLLLCAILCVAFGFAQQTTRNGVVKDASTGSGIVGATVAVKGTSNSTQTDATGSFSISASIGQTLVFSFIGYDPKEVAVEKATTMTVELISSDHVLDELVVVGYGSQKRSDITGSVASVPKERLSNLPVTNVMQAIQGAVSNVSISQASSIPGDSPATQVRGLNSMSAGSGPYIVVDGIPLTKTDGSINDINPNDIESVEILKDPSAVAIYGVNGSNGVILITTKRGVIGTPTIRYSGYAG